MKKIKLFILLMCVFILTGCWDSTEINKLSIVLGIGVDEEKENEVKTVIQIAVPNNMGQNHENGASGAKYTNYVMYGGNIAEAVSKTVSKTGSELSLAHNLLLLVGRKTAEKGIYKHVDYLIRDIEPRLNIVIAVADGDMEEILKTDSEVISMPSEYLWWLSSMQKNYTGGGYVRLIDFMQNLMSKSGGTLVPIIKTDKGSEPAALTIEEAAVFKDEKMTGTISLADVRGIMWAQNRVEGGILNVGSGKDLVTYKILNSDVKRIIETDGKIKLNLDIHLKLAVLSDSGDVIHIYGTKKAQEQASEKVRRQVIDAIEEAKRMDVDILHIADEIYKYRPEYWEEIQGKWDEMFAAIEENVEVDCEILYTGLIEATPSKENKN